MKKSLLITMVLFVLLVQSASAGSQTYIQTIPAGNNFIWNLQMNGVGLVRFAVDWQPVKKGEWTFHVYKETEGGGVDPAYDCYWGNKRDKPGHWECIFSDAPIGFYVSIFTAVKTQTVVTETMTACHNGTPCDYP